MELDTIKDIHTHHPYPQPEAVISTGPDGFIPETGQYYSVGVHPWDTSSAVAPEIWALLEDAAAQPEVVAIGEAGIDLLKGGLLYLQLQIFRRQVLLSEKTGKPLIIHDVKAHDIISGLKRDLNPRCNWAIHGFRAKPAVAKMFTDKGIYLSFGEKFNSETLKEMPEDLILAETDESTKTIDEIIENLSSAKGKDLSAIIIENTKRFLESPGLTVGPFMGNK